MVRHLRFAILAVILMAASTPTTRAGVVLFSDRPTFNAAAPGLALQDFETPFPSGTSIVFPGFTANAGQGLTMLQTFFPVPINSNTLSTDGNTTVSLVFNSPITAFGVDIIDFGNGFTGSLSVTDNTGSFNQTLATVPPSLVSANRIFFGVTDSTPFTSITITQTTAPQGDSVFYDNVAFGLAPAGSTAPEPSSLLLVAIGSLGLGAYRYGRLRSRRTCG